MPLERFRVQLPKRERCARKTCWTICRDRSCDQNGKESVPLDSCSAVATVSRKREKVQSRPKESGARRLSISMDVLPNHPCGVFSTESFGWPDFRASIVVDPTSVVGCSGWSPNDEPFLQKRLGSRIATAAT